MAGHQQRLSTRRGDARAGLSAVMTVHFTAKTQGRAVSAGLASLRRGPLTRRTDRRRDSGRPLVNGLRLRTQRFPTQVAAQSASQYTLPHPVHPFMHTFTHSQATASESATQSGAGRVRRRRWRCLAQGDTSSTPLRLARGSNQQPSGYYYQPSHSTS